MGLALIGATLVVAFIVYKYRYAVHQYNNLVHQYNNLVHEENNLAHKYNNIGRDLEKTQKELIDSKADVTKLIRHRFVKDSSVRTDALIITLRDYVYKKTVLGDGDFDNGNAVDHFIKLDLHEKRMLCGGMAATYSWLLRQFGIPSRAVALATKSFVDGDRFYDTHVSVEVYDEVNQKWYASDPTFNVSFTCNEKGELLDYEELVSCLRRGGRITAARNGVTYLKGRTVEKNPIPYSDLLFAIQAAEVTSSDGRVLKEALALPHKDWLDQSLNGYVSGY